MNANEQKSAMLIVMESAAILKGHADRMRSMSPNDFRAQTAANLTMDYVKKLAWVYDVISKQPTE